MPEITLSLSAVILIVLMVIRAIDNYHHYSYHVFAFATTIIVNELVWSVLLDSFSTSFLFTSNPYQSLFTIVINAICFFWFYKFLTADWFRSLMVKTYPNLCSYLKIYGRYITIFVEIIATILAYQALTNIPTRTIAIFILSATEPDNSNFSFYALLTILAVRFVYNVFLGNYKTLVFWWIFVATMIIYSLIDVEYIFPLMVIIFLYINYYVFAYLATEENLYWVFAKSEVSERTFAYIIHFLTTVAEAVACLMILSLFVDSYVSLLRV